MPLKISERMDSTIDRLISTATAPSSSAGADDFIPSSTWTGPRPGYYFGTSNQGTGYYIDTTGAGAGSANGDGPARKRARLENDNVNNPQDDGGGKTIRFGTDLTHPIPSRHQQKQKTGEELLAEAEAALAADQSSSTFGSAATITLTPSGIRQACANLTKCATQNEMDRAQHPDDPAQFMESEVMLNSAVEALKDVAAAVHLYPTLVETNGGEAVTNLVGLLGHENGDVSASVLGVLGEWTDPDLLLTASGGGEGEEAVDPTTNALRVGSLTNAFLSTSGMLDLLVGNLGRYEEEVEEERAGIEQALTVVENCLDLDRAGALRLAWQEAKSSANGGEEGDDEDGVSGDNGAANGKKEYQSAVQMILQSTTLLTYLVQRASDGSSSDSSIRLHASELLSSILQHDDARLYAANISQLPPFRSVFEEDDDGGGTSSKKKPSSDDAAAKVDGMECLLQSIAPYRKRDPQTAEEVEILENIYDALAACLQNSANVQAFLDGQGIELMLRCIRNGGHGGYGACKILYFACSGSSLPSEDETSYKRACETLVEAGGLKQIFPLFMGRSAAIPNPAPCSDAGRGLALARKKAENGDDNDKKQKKRKKKADAARKEWLREVEGNSIRILYELTRHLDDGSPNDSKNRLLAKFLEGDCVSTDVVVSCNTSPAYLLSFALMI